VETTFVYSQLSAQSAEQLVASNYDVATLENCNFYARGLHDNYLLHAPNRKYILRIYRKQWRTAEEISFELDVLDFLSRNGAPVAYPLQTKHDELSIEIECPEGKRYAALFHYADGYAPGNDISVEESTLLGKSVAKIHRLSENYKTRYTRPTLDIHYLLDESIVSIEPFVSVETLEYLKSIQHKLHQRLPSLPHEAGIYGICIGDVNPTNFHVADNDLTIFDFDQCGLGYRAFEIGKFLSSIYNTKQRSEIAQAFLAGYQQVRQLSHEEITAIPYFEMISVIWVMAINAKNSDLIGYKWLDKDFWDRKMALLDKLNKAL